jgi:hypothetical protein
LPPEQIKVVFVVAEQLLRMMKGVVLGWPRSS